MTIKHIQVMLGRRPAKTQGGAFGHVDISAAGRTHLQTLVEDIVRDIRRRTEVPFHPDDEADSGEVLTAKLKNFDAWFQPKAPWSLERAVAEIQHSGLPTPLDEKGIRDGGWTFYAIRARVSNTEAVLVRAKSPSYGLTGPGKLVTAFIGTELRPVGEPLIAFDHSADLVVLGRKVFVLNPRSAERLLVDAEAVKARAATTAGSFNQKLGAPLDSPTLSAVQRVCSKNANVARRVERLIRDGALAKVTAAEVRSALPNAGLPKSAFGKSGPLKAGTDAHATVLIDICADLYYQPRFDSAPRRVAIYRRV